MENYYLVRLLLGVTLPQRDSNLARMLFSSLYRSLFATVDTELTEHEGERTVKAIKDGLNAVLESSTDCCAPFIGSLHVSVYGDIQMYIHVHTRLCVQGIGYRFFFWDFFAGCVFP